MTRETTMMDRRIEDPADLDDLSFSEEGLLPVVAQDADSGAVLMVAYASREALERTLVSGQMHYWSRSRRELWHKGATSGSYQDLLSLHADCDGDTILARVRPRGPACHTGDATCFGELLGAVPESTIPGLWAVLENRASQRPASSYTVRLLDDENLRLKKLGEETAELILALSRGDDGRILEEAADLIYHLLVALKASGGTLEGLLRELDIRKR